MLTIGITTYNRLSTLKKMAKSLYDSKINIAYNIRIYDDASSDYGIETLRKLFPNAATIKRNERTVKADKNIYLMYKDFLSTNDEYLFNADSDLLFSNDWIDQGMKRLKKTDGVLALLNLDSIRSFKNKDNSNILEKLEVGSAGVLMSRKIVKEIITNFNYENIDEPGFDRSWCSFFKEKGTKIYCVRNSLVQHIGIKGQNANSDYFEFGVGFKVDSNFQGQVFNDLLLKISREKYKPKYYIFPFSHVPKNSRIVIYGFGNVGSNFLKQLTKEKYCDVVGVVDKNWKRYTNELVHSPNVIKKLNFDYIIIAVNSKALFEQIKLELLEIDKRIEDKIIFQKYSVS